MLMFSKQWFWQLKCSVLSAMIALTDKASKVDVFRSTFTC